MEQFSQFKTDKQSAIHHLNELAQVLSAFAEMGVDVRADLEKIGKSIAAIENDVLRIALLGAFSDGKTSVIAAWIGRVMADMNISMDESSDRLAVYRPEGLPDKCEIVDTPGLFGDKEKTVEGKQVLYQDLTKEYISQAHLILYVVDATNPLKDSHGDIARWVLRDLNKLTSTVFVINKMDEVTDLTEEALFKHQSAIKIDNLKGKLQRLVGLTQGELDQVNIICMAANPNGRGLPFWFGKPEHYVARSRINALKDVTNRVLRENVPAVLQAKTGTDVVRELVANRLVTVQANLETLSSLAAQRREEAQRIQEDLDQGRTSIKRMIRELFDELDTLEKRLLSTLRPLTLSDLGIFVDEEIGTSLDDPGYKLKLKIKTIIDTYFEQSTIALGRLNGDIQAQVEAGESFLRSMVGSGVGLASNALGTLSKMDVATVKQGVFFARDLLDKVAGVTIKFKPWGAHNLAASATKYAGPAAVALQLGSDAYDLYKSTELEKELLEKKNKISSVIKSAFKDVYDVLSSDEKAFEIFCPNLSAFDQTLKQINIGAAQIQQHQQKLITIRERLSHLSEE
jgi:predicted GTPase